MHFAVSDMFSDALLLKLLSHPGHFKFKRNGQPFKRTAFSAECTVLQCEILNGRCCTTVKKKKEWKGNVSTCFTQVKRVQDYINSDTGMFFT